MATIVKKREETLDLPFQMDNDEDMILYPAIDLQAGRCVRLCRGDFDAATIYEADPLEQARRFADAGAVWLHVVDLDGARQESMRQFSLIEKLAKATSLQIQIGGGIRSQDDIAAILQAGAKRVVIGSLAVEDPELVKRWLRHFGADKISLAMDIRLNGQGKPEVLTKGWQESSQQTLWSVLVSYKDSGLQTILCTDVSRDGMLSGANIPLYATIKSLWQGQEIIASGGVASLEDLRLLAAQGVNGAIIGKALYEGRIDLREALLAVQKNP